MTTMEISKILISYKSQWAAPNMYTRQYLDSTLLSCVFCILKGSCQSSNIFFILKSSKIEHACNMESTRNVRNLFILKHSFTSYCLFLGVSSSVLSVFFLSSIIITLTKQLNTDGTLETKMKNGTDAFSEQQSHTILDTVCIAQNLDYDNLDSLRSSQDWSWRLDVALHKPSKDIEEQ